MGSIIGPAGARSLTSAIVAMVASLVVACVVFAAPGDFAERDLSPPQKAGRSSQSSRAAAHSPVKRVKASSNTDDQAAAQDEPDEDAPEEGSADTAASPADQPAENAPPADTGGDVSYVIRSGDSVGAISAMFHIAAEDIFRHNHLNPDSTLHIGEVVRIPNPYVAQVRGLQAKIDSLSARTQDQEHKLQEGNSRERASNARIVELAETNRALEHDVTTLPWWRRATTVAVSLATLMFALALASLLQWFLMRRRFAAVVVANERLSRLDQRYRTLLARVELRLQQLYGRRRAVVDSPQVRSPEDFELERLNRELKEVLERQMAQLGVQPPLPPGARGFANGRPIWAPRSPCAPVDADSRRASLRESRITEVVSTPVLSAATPAPARPLAQDDIARGDRSNRSVAERRAAPGFVVRLTLAAMAVMLILVSGCSLLKHSKSPAAAAPEAQASEESESAETPAAEATPPPPTVTVQISYVHRDDYVESMSVAKFASAELIPTHAQKGGAALVRFEGGEPVWEIAADRGVSGSLLGHVPGVAENKKFAITEVTYGTVPKNFAKQEPENSDPEPLEAGKYYIFTVRRASGTTSYQAVHIPESGAVVGYDAQPRAGTSYELCCDVAPDFASPPSNPDDQSSAPSEP